MLPPRFAADRRELEQRSGEAKQWECPHCRRAGEINRHGVLRGLGENGPGKRAVRGARFFCSNRGRRRGCGRTFSVWLAAMIAGASVRTAPLWRFTLERLGGASVLGAWERGCSGFSLEAAYGWWRRWLRGEPLLRTIVAKGRDPPTAPLTTVLVAAYGALDPIAGFQFREQRDWP